MGIQGARQRAAGAVGLGDHCKSAQDRERRDVGALPSALRGTRDLAAENFQLLAFPPNAGAGPYLLSCGGAGSRQVPDCWIWKPNGPHR